MRPERPRIPILIYHRVNADGDIDRLSQLLTIEESRFLLQMQYLAENGFETLTLPRFLALRKGNGEIPERSIIISFDDGFENMYTRAVPILERFGLRATFFIVSGRVGTKDYLSWDQLLEMKAAGMNIESHTHTHPVLTELPNEQMYEELRMSKEILEDRLGTEITTLCVPGGFINASVSQAARDIGYEAICTSLPGLNRIDKAHYELRRISIRGFDSMPRFKDLVSGGYGRIYVYRMRQTALAAIRKAMGRKTYEKAKTFYLSR